MQAGRELDAKVAEALGLTDSEDGWWIDEKGFGVLPTLEFRPSTTWEGMGLLVEEAAKQGVLLEYEHFREGRYLGRAWQYCEENDDWISIPRDSAIKPPITNSAPHAVCLAFLKAKGIAV